jgi:hypothetical protein
VVRYLTERGFSVYRPRTTSARNTDTGDVAGVPCVLSVKNWRTLRLAQWVDEMLVMVRRSAWRIGAVVHKRPRKGNARDWYVTLPLEMFVDLLDAYVTKTSTSTEQPRRTAT